MMVDLSPLLIRPLNSTLGSTWRTDGSASNNSQDMFEVVKAAALLQRARLQDPQAIRPMQALRMATINGAKALGLDRLVGSLEPGKRADLILLDLRAAPHNVAVHNVVSHLVHCAKATDVEGRLMLPGCSPPAGCGSTLPGGERSARRSAGSRGGSRR